MLQIITAVSIIWSRIFCGNEKSRFLESTKIFECIWSFLIIFFINSKDELEADLALEKQIDELENEETEGSFGLSEELMNRKFAAKIDRGEFNERTYKQCIADELLKDCLKTILSHSLNLEID